MNNRLKKFYICLCLIGCLVSLSACGTDEPIEESNPSNENVTQTESQTSELIELESADEIFDGDYYLDKKVRVKGLANYDDASSGTMKLYGELSGLEVYLAGSEKYEMPISWCAIVTGVVKNDEYGGKIIEVESLEACTDETCRHNGIAEENANYIPSTEELKSLCNQVSWEELTRYPDSYIGQYVKMTGIVTSPGDSSILVATRVDNGIFYEDYVWVEFDSSSSGTRFLEEDRITIYGIANGLKSYTTVAGGSKTVPLIQAIVIEFAN